MTKREHNYLSSTLTPPHALLSSGTDGKLRRRSKTTGCLNFHSEDLKMNFYTLAIGQGRRILTKLQPLTIVSSEKNSAVSDLFIWKNDKNWRTYFRLVDHDRVVSGPTLKGKDKHATFVYFSSRGVELKRVAHTITQEQSSLISVSEDLADCTETFGTFCVIHNYSPADLITIGCQLTERGYVGYSFRDSKILSYSHGNFDAVSMKANGSIEMLGGISILKREYRLQYLLNTREEHLIAFVNPYKKIIKLHISLRDKNGDKMPAKSFSVKLPPLGCSNTILPSGLPNEHFTIRVKSRLCMARPTVFVQNGKSFNVFHG